MNHAGSTVEHALVEELERCNSSPSQSPSSHRERSPNSSNTCSTSTGRGTVITSDFLGFNQPQAFAELLNLSEHTGIDVRRHTAKGFHPKGYVFERGRSVTAIDRQLQPDQQRPVAEP